MATLTRLFLHTEPPTRRILARQRAREGERWLLASDWIREEDRTAFDACIELPPPQEVAATVRRLRELDFDDLVVQSEYALLPGALLAAERGIPAPTPMAAFLCTNKWLCRRALQAAGVPVPRFALARTEREARAFVERFPVVLKPVASTMGHLVTRVDSAGELAGAVERVRRGLAAAPEVARCIDFARLAGFELGCDPLREFLVEDFALGEPCETDGLVIGSEPNLFGATAQVLCDGPGIYIDGYLFPVDRPELVETTPRVLRAVGLTDAGFSIEFRGSTVIEINGRLGEDEGFPDLFEAALGEAPVLRWLRRTTSPLRAEGCHAVAYRSVLRDVLVQRVPASSSATILVEPGARLHAPPHPALHPHVAWALRSDPHDARRAYAAARAVVDALDFTFADAGEGSR